LKNSGLLNNAIRIICTIAVIAMVLVSIFVYHAPAGGLLLFLLFLVFYVELPGLLITSAAGVRMPHASGTAIVSFFTGWALVVAEYFVTDLIGTKILLYTLGPLCSLLYLFLVFSERMERPSAARLRPSRVPAAFYVAAVILMAYVFLTTQFLYLSPEYSDNVYASIDKVYQMGLTTSLSHGYPLVDPWVHGRNVSYHIFSQVLLSVPIMLFGMTPDFMIISCSPYLTVSLISLSVYALFRQFCRRKERAGLYTLSVILSNMFIARSATSSYLFRILFTNDNYGGFGLAGIAVCTLFLGYYFSDREESGRTNIPKLLLLTALVMLLTGIKAPVGLVFAGAVIGTYLLGLILRRISFAGATPPFVMITLGFVAVYEFLLGSGEATGTDGGSIVSFGHMTGICFWKERLIEVMKGMGLPSPLRLLIILLVFAAFFFTAYTLAFFIGYIRELALVIVNKKEYDFAWVTVYAGAFIGFVLMMFLNYSGHSQIYFGTVLVAFAPLIAFRFFEDRDEMTSSFMKALRVICAVWFFAVLAVTSVTVALDIKGMVPVAAAHSNPSAHYGLYASLTKDEYEAVSWLKENTPEDALIATQMYSSVEISEYDVTQRWHNCHFLYASYSDRKFYLEGSGFSLADNEAEKRLEMKKNTDLLYEPDNTERGELARSLGISHVMVTKKIYPTPDLTSDDYKLVFSNDDIDIYEVAQ